MHDLEQLSAEGYVIDPEAFSDMDEQEQRRLVFFLKQSFFEPGFKVALDQASVERNIALLAERGVDTSDLATLHQLGRATLQVEQVVWKGHYNTFYKLKGHDSLVSGVFVKDARPTIQAFGIVLPHNGSLYAIALDGNFEAPVATAGYEILAGVEPGFGSLFGAKTVEELIASMATEEEINIAEGISGEFVVAENGHEAWSLSYCVWFSGTSEAELRVARDFIDHALQPRFRPN